MHTGNGENNFHQCDSEAAIKQDGDNDKQSLIIDVDLVTIQVQSTFSLGYISVFATINFKWIWLGKLPFVESNPFLNHTKL